MKREEFNKLNPVGAGYNAFAQTKQFMKENPVVPSGELPIPEISEQMGLTLEQAKSEYNQLFNAPQPLYGWSTGIAGLLDARLSQLKTMVFDHVMKAASNTDAIEREDEKNGE